MTLRPFCRAHALHNGRAVNCHRMKGHKGPHRTRFDEGHSVGEIAPAEWYTAVELTGPVGVAR